MQKKPVRKPIRLKDYDYSESGAYFVTVCTHEGQHLFGEIPQNVITTVGEDSISSRVHDGMNTVASEMINDIFLKTIAQYPTVSCPKYVIMPNHFHAIITITRADIESAPTICTVMQSFKRHSTIEYIKLVKNNILPPFNKKIWQRSYHEHIIRVEADYLMIWQYIDTNPMKWELDKYYND